MRWARVRWRRFLFWAVAREGGVILRAQGVTDVRGGLEQCLSHIDAFEGPPRRLKGKLKEVVRRCLEVWDVALPWTPENRGTVLDRKVTNALIER